MINKTFEVDLSKFNTSSIKTQRSNQPSFLFKKNEKNPGKKSRKGSRKPKIKGSSRQFLSQNRRYREQRIEILKTKQKSKTASRENSTLSYESRKRKSGRANKFKKSSSSLKNVNIPKLTKIYYTDKLIEALSRKDPDDPFMRHFNQSSQSIVYINSIAAPSEDTLVEKKFYLPPQGEPKKTLIFDLDEILIHRNKDPEAHCDSRIEVKFPSGEKTSIGIIIRPFARNCLQKLSKYFELIIFTASHPCYANEVINLLDPKGEIFSARVFRDRCCQTEEGIFVKDLRVLANRNEKDILIVDNAVYSYGFNLHNGVPLLPFFGDKKDAELLDLCGFLIKMKDVNDLRKVVKKYFMIDLFEKYAVKSKVLKKKILMNRNKLY